MDVFFKRAYNWQQTFFSHYRKWSVLMHRTYYWNKACA